MASDLPRGTQKYGTVTNPMVAGVVSTTQDPMPPVEYSKDAAASKYTTTNSSGNPIS